MTIKAIVFDMDDTLYAEKDYVRSGMIHLDNFIKMKFNIKGFYETSMALFEVGERKFIFNKSLQLLNIPYDIELIHEMVKNYRSHKPNIKLFNDAKWVLENLSNDVKIGLISDGYFEAQAKKVHALRLKERFDSVILSDRFGKVNWKPSRIPYEQATIELELVHKECVYIGDNVTKDFITAKKLGWKTVHLVKKCGIYSNIEVNEEYLAHYKIDDLKKLSSIPELKHLFIEQNTPLYF